MRWLLLLALPVVALAQNTSGTTDVNNLSTNQQGNNITNSSNSNNNSNSTTYNGNAPGSAAPPVPMAPAYMGVGQDSCLIGLSGAVTSSVIGIAGGTYKRDEQCELLKLSKTLNDFGLKVAAVAVLCQDSRVYQAMAMAGTPCPYLGAIGKQATVLWQQNPEMRPDYEKQPLKPIALATGTHSDDSGSLSDRYRASKRTVNNDSESKRPEPESTGSSEQPAK
jgi:hypothetical protein